MHKVRRVCLLVLILSMMIGTSTSVNALQPASDTPELCFSQTGHCIDGVFVEYWRSNGGLPVFGYPIFPARHEVNADTGETYLTQWFERTRLEYHPELADTPYSVLLGRLGADSLTPAPSEPRESGPQAGCLWFETTGFNVCNQGTDTGFMAYWQSHGLTIPALSNYEQSLALFGYPITAAKLEVSETDGKTYLTQWFERARFEWHPDEPAQYQVLLGLLGSELQAAFLTPPPVCTIPDIPTRGAVRYGADPFCFAWDDTYSNETAFRITLEYSQTKERFVYETPPDTISLIIPAEDAPQPDTCDRVDFSVSVDAILPTGAVNVGGFARDSHCIP